MIIEAQEVVRSTIARLIELERQPVARQMRTRRFYVDFFLVADSANALRRIGEGEAVEGAIAALRRPGRGYCERTPWPVARSNHRAPGRSDHAARAGRDVDQVIV